MHETRNRKVHHTQEETAQWILVHLAKARANKVKASMARAKAKGSKDSMDQHGQDKDMSKDKNKDSVECWNCGKRGHYSTDCWSKKNTNKGGSKGKHKPKNADAHDLDLKPSNVEPEVEIGGFNMFYLDAHAVEVPRV